MRLIYKCNNGIVCLKGLMRGNTCLKLWLAPTLAGVYSVIFLSVCLAAYIYESDWDVCQFISTRLSGGINAFASASQRDARTHAGTLSADAGRCQAAVVDTRAQIHTLSCTKLKTQRCGIELLCTRQGETKQRGEAAGVWLESSPLVPSSCSMCVFVTARDLSWWSGAVEYKHNQKNGSRD